LREGGGREREEWELLLFRVANEIIPQLEFLKTWLYWVNGVGQDWGLTLLLPSPPPIASLFLFLCLCKISCNVCVCVFVCRDGATPTATCTLDSWIGCRDCVGYRRGTGSCGKGHCRACSFLCV